MKRDGQESNNMPSNCYILCFSLITPVFAQGTVEKGPPPEYPIVDDSEIWSEAGEPYTIYTEDGCFVQSHSISKQEIELAELLSEPHIHAGDVMPQHFHLTPHFHSIRNVVDSQTSILG